MAKRYFWLKLKEDFFEDPRIALLMREKRGKEMIFFYIFLLVKSIGGEGCLTFNEARGYTDTELAHLAGFSGAMVANSLKCLTECGFLHRDENNKIFLSCFSGMVGSETDKAKMMRRFRENGNNVTKVLPECYLEKEIDKEIEIESEIEKEGKGEVVLGKGQDLTDYRVELSLEQKRSLIAQMGAERLANYLEKMDEFTDAKHRKFKDPYQTILKWYQEDENI